MNEVRMDLQAYDNMRDLISKKKEEVEALKEEIEALKKQHEEEIDKLAKEGKVKVIEKPYSVMYMMMTRREPKTEYKGFDDVKAEVYEHFKQGLFKEELEKRKCEQLDNLMKQLSEKDNQIDNLENKVERLQGRSLLSRIINK